MKIKEVTTYEILEEREIAELRSKATVCRHKKTGAKVILMENEDENKVFYIGFRTTPRESTGVSHILEHSVLCGSEEFPVKDPFVELVKGSLNTFLNAMTYSDKTVYPIASCNDADFQNLMHVYLDAVFKPNIYKHKEIFLQEGWHYEMENAEAPLTYNGVVYNEMKGAFSAPEQVLFRKISQTLYPDTTYGVESGGDPVNIPDLTYEDFLDFHRRYYHPSNAWIYLYGDMNVEEKLTFMDDHYLSHYDAIEIDSSIQILFHFLFGGELLFLSRNLFKQFSCSFLFFGGANMQTPIKGTGNRPLLFCRCIPFRMGERAVNEFINSVTSLKNHSVIVQVFPLVSSMLNGDKLKHLQCFLIIGRQCRLFFPFLDSFSQGFKQVLFPCNSKFNFLVNFIH